MSRDEKANANPVENSQEPEDDSEPVSDPEAAQMRTGHDRVGWPPREPNFDYSVVLPDLLFIRPSSASRTSMTISPSSFTLVLAYLMLLIWHSDIIAGVPYSIRACSCCLPLRIHAMGVKLRWRLAHGVYAQVLRHALLPLRGPQRKRLPLRLRDPHGS